MFYWGHTIMQLHAHADTQIEKYVLKKSDTREVSGNTWVMEEC